MSMPDFKYASINAKLKGMNAKNLDKEELMELIKQNNLRSAISILKQEFVPLANMNEDIERIELERELDRITINDITKISKYLNDKEKEVFYLFISKYELECIKQALKSIIQKSKRKEEIITLWTDTVFKNIRKIKDAENEDDFIIALKKSNYFETIEQYIKEKEGINNIQISDFEIRLDNEYYEELYKKAQDYNKVLKELIGKEVDFNNIITIYRLKKYYNYDSEKIKDRLIKKHYRINDNLLEQLLNANNYEDMYSILLQTSYKKIIENTKEEELEKTIDEYIYRQYKKVFTQTEYNIVTVIAYVVLEEYQKRNIINVLEGITYGLDKKDIENKIII